VKFEGEFKIAHFFISEDARHLGNASLFPVPDEENPTPFSAVRFATISKHHVE
jgi:hypothetical protein